MNVGVIESSSAGFFSNFRGTVSAFKNCEDQGLIPHVNWGKNSIYYDSNYGENVWEYYFEPISDGQGSTINIEQDFSWRNLPYTREKMYSLIKKYVKLKESLNNEINDFYYDNFKGRNVVGVHIRLTDKFNFPTESKTIVSADKYIKHIDEYLKNNDNSYVYVSTDSTDYLPTIKSTFGDRVLINNDIIRSNGEKSVHHHTNGSGYKKGKDVVMETLLLSKCDYLIKGISNVSLCSLFFNKKLHSFNVASYYNNDTREDFVNNNG